jgi:hypothetical protein
MADEHHSPQPHDQVKAAIEAVTEGAEGDEPSSKRGGAGHAEYSRATSLSYAELVELWHHQHNVAMHKERLYVPSSLAVLIGTILGWRDLSAGVVALAGLASIGLQVYLILIMSDFAMRQDRFFTLMREQRSDILRVMFNESLIRFRADQTLVGPPTVQRRVRPLFLGTLILIWMLLVLIKARGGA